MMTLVAIVHVIFCLLLIALVLLQDPKGGGTGAVFGGGGSNSLLGATGAVTFLTRLTRYSAIIFGITCLILTLLSRPETGSVLDSTPANAATPPPTTPVPGGSTIPSGADGKPLNKPVPESKMPDEPTTVGKPADKAPKAPNTAP